MLSLFQLSLGWLISSALIRRQAGWGAPRLATLHFLQLAVFARDEIGQIGLSKFLRFHLHLWPLSHHLAREAKRVLILLRYARHISTSSLLLKFLLAHVPSAANILLIKSLL